MNWNSICKFDDILPGTGVGALVDGLQLAIFRLDDDSVFVIDNFDPHSQANVLSRGIVGCVDHQAVVASPIYKQHFRLVDGVCLEDPSKSVAAHQVEIVDGTVQVCLNSALSQAA